MAIRLMNHRRKDGEFVSLSAVTSSLQLDTVSIAIISDIRTVSHTVHVIPYRHIHTYDGEQCRTHDGRVIPGG